jgi:hypothetical protein
MRRWRRGSEVSIDPRCDLLNQDGEVKSGSLCVKSCSPFFDIDVGCACRDNGVNAAVLIPDAPRIPDALEGDLLNDRLY